MDQPAETRPAGDAKYFGRRRGRPLNKRKAGLIETALSRVTVDRPPEGAILDPATLFDPRRAAVWLEIGFGGGEHLAAQAAARPDLGFLGCEPFLNGVASLLDLLERTGGDNVRVHADDARPFLDRMAEASVGRAFVLYPDPWPKKRHHERRFIVPSNLDRLARVLVDGAELRMASDVPELVTWMAEQVRLHPLFEGPDGAPEDWGVPPPDWVATRYERKALAAGRTPAYLTARRVARAG